MVLKVTTTTRIEKFLFLAQQTYHGTNERMTFAFHLHSYLNFFSSSPSHRDIDTAFLRRFERKIHIDVPTLHERQNLIKHFLPNSQQWREDDLEELALLSENFTGDDIRVAIKEANMMIIRKKIRNENFTNLTEMDIECHHLRDAFKHIKPNSENDILRHREWISSFVKS